MDTTRFWWLMFIIRVFIDSIEHQKYKFWKKHGRNIIFCVVLFLMGMLTQFLIDLRDPEPSTLELDGTPTPNELSGKYGHCATQVKDEGKYYNELDR
eukprot:UN05589